MAHGPDSAISARQEVGAKNDRPLSFDQIRSVHIHLPSVSITTFPS
jgi:hypothetical protein